MVPIAIAYVFAHNWTAILTAIPVIPFLLADPFGMGWNLIGLRALPSAEPGRLNMGPVWHAEVAIILVGHVAGVCAAHLIAIHTFRRRRAVWLSEVPMLVPMVGYTCIGLIVLSLPLALH